MDGGGAEEAGEGSPGDLRGWLMVHIPLVVAVEGISGVVARVSEVARQQSRLTHFSSPKSSASKVTSSR